MPPPDAGSTGLGLQQPDLNRRPGYGSLWRHEIAPSARRQHNEGVKAMDHNFIEGLKDSLGAAACEVAYRANRVVKSESQRYGFP